MTEANHLIGRDLISLLDFKAEEVRGLLDLAVQVKKQPGAYADKLVGQTLFMYFEKPSLRTRVTFETGMTQLGGHAINYSAAEGRIGVRESIEDVARNLERWVQAAMCRTFSHEMLEQLARFASIPVINGLTDHLHPCQALADYLTLLEVRPKIEGCTLSYIGDGNNVAHSLMHGGARLGVNVRVICPKGYEPDARVVAAAKEAGRETGASIEVHHEVAAVEGSDAVYTDVWASMGQEEEAAERKRVFAPFQVNDGVMRTAGPDAVFLHCLPAHRGEEVTDSVADSTQSMIFQQAENRLHAQKAVLLAVMDGAS